MEPVSGLVRDRGGLPSLSRTVALARWVCLSVLRRQGRTLSRQPCPADVPVLSASEHGHSGHDLREDAYTLEGLAGGSLVYNQSETGRQCFGIAKGPGAGQLSNCVDYAASFSSRDGPPGREQLAGTVEVDEVYLAIHDRRVAQSGTGRKSRTTKALIVVAVEIQEPKGFGRIRLQRIADDTAACVLPFVREVVEPGSLLHTDGSSIYHYLTEEGYQHRRIVMSGADSPAHVSMHRVSALFKRWLLGTHHGAVKPLQLDHYLDEFVFRFNRRTSRSRGQLFYRLLEQAVAAEPVTYRQIAQRPPKAAALP